MLYCKPIHSPQPTKSIMQHTQILPAVSPGTAHITFPFPYTFGQYGVLRSWVQTGNNNSKVQRRTNYKQHWWSTLGEILDNNTCNWHAPKCKLVADIILLYMDNHPYSKFTKLPQALSLDFKDATGTNTTAAQILHFINPTAYPTQYPTLPDPALFLPIRYFNTIQRQLLIKQLLALGEPPATVSSILWSNPPLNTPAHQELLLADHNLGHLQINNKLDKQVSKAQAIAFAASPEGKRAAFFKLHTRIMFPRERPEGDPGWPDPQSLIERELQDLDDKWRTHPLTLERHQKWELAFTHWANLNYLQQHHPTLFTPTELAIIAQQVEHVTNPPTPSTNHSTPNDNPPISSNEPTTE